MRELLGEPELVRAAPDVTDEPTEPEGLAERPIDRAPLAEREPEDSLPPDGRLGPSPTMPAVLGSMRGSWLPIMPPRACVPLLPIGPDCPNGRRGTSGWPSGLLKRAMRSLSEPETARLPVVGTTEASSGAAFGSSDLRESAADQRPLRYADMVVVSCPITHAGAVCRE